MTSSRIFRYALVLLRLCVLNGCVTSSVTRLNDMQRDPISPSQVTIYLEEQDIPSEYQEMALIDISGSSGWTDQSDIYKKARKKAAEIGANGVLYRSYEEAGTGERVASALFGTYSDNDAEMVAIHVIDADANADAAGKSIAEESEAQESGDGEADEDAEDNSEEDDSEEDGSDGR